MSGNYEYVDHTADIAVEVKADSIKELFELSAAALMESSMDIQSPDGEKSLRKINLNEYSTEELLVSFLNELNYFVSVKHWVLLKVALLDIEEYEDIWQLKSVCEGSSEIKFTRKEEIKAVTFHQMAIKQEKGIYTCRIVFDI